MKHRFAIITLLACVSLPAFAKEKPLPITDEVAAALEGKSLMIVRHAKPDFSAMSAGKASFGLLGAVAMIKAGNDLVESNRIQDNAVILQEVLVPLIVSRYKMALLDENANHTALKKPEEIALEQPKGDYLLDIFSGSWMFLYFPTDWNSYFTMYSAQVRLIDRSSGKPVVSLACIMNGKKLPNPPGHADMLDNQAQLLKAMLASQGWECAHLLAKEAFRIPAAELPPVPEAYIDPQGKFAAAKSALPATASAGATGQ